MNISIPFLARIFGSVQGVCLIYLSFFPLLAQSFFLQSLSFLNRRSQRQQTSAGRQNTEVYFEYCLGRWMHIIRRITAVASVSLCDLCGLNFVSFVYFVVKPKIQNKAKQSQTKPIFWRPNPILSPKVRIFDKFKTTFLCKTKPIYFYPAPKYLVLGLFENLISA